MRVFRSFFVRLLEILSAATAVNLLVMGITLYIQLDQENAILFVSAAAVMAVVVGILHLIIRKTDPELVLEVARFLYPGGGLICLGMSVVMMLWLDGMIAGTEGNQHYTVGFVGVAFAAFLTIRCFDIKWMRSEDEIYGTNDD